MPGLLLWAICAQQNASFSSLFSLIPRNGTQSRFKFRSRLNFSTGFSAVAHAVANPSRSSEDRVYEVMLKQAALVRDLNKPVETDGLVNWDLLNGAYHRCGEVCAEYVKTYLGTLLMTPERRRAMWTIYDFGCHWSQ